MQKKDYKEDGRRLLETWLYSVGMAFALLAVIAVMCLICGCTTAKYLPAERVVVRSDTVTHYVYGRDSLRVIERVYESDSRYDSIVPILDSLNRVIGWDRYHFRDLTKMNQREVERLQATVDSLRAVSADTVRITVPYPVERELTKWEKTKMDFGGIAMGGAVVAVIAAAVLAWMAIRRRRK